MNKVQKLAENVMKNSVNLVPGEKVFIDAKGLKSIPMFEAFIEATVKLGGIPFYFLNDIRFTNAMLKYADKEQIDEHCKIHLELMKHMDVYIGFSSMTNPYDASDVSDESQADYSQCFAKVLRYRVDNTRWCVLRYPNDVMAYEAGMSTKQFTDFLLDACLLDYSKMEPAMNKLAELMSKTDKVRIVAPETDISFSIKGIGAVVCSGHRNIPDGEVYSAPVKDSINGVIRFNTTSHMDGKKFANIKLWFENGKIVNCEHNGNKEDLEDIFNIDAGARYVGEFALGVNPFITKDICNILFDEKIAGSLHMAIGNCYKSAPNGNKSAIHWDLVLIQTPDYGGGQIYFDDVLIRDNGLFVIDELKCLNPDELKLTAM
ncbi:MAG: aminopeptidase [Alphaproteobacteria bacterium]|nr:aminopeptidase [Alphaproteobacteria bacterium]